jgi:hypothetical protein
MVVTMLTFLCHVRGELDGALWCQLNPIERACKDEHGESDEL